METRLPVISTDTLREWLENDKPVNVVDVRPTQEHAEWHIPGSIHIDAYDKLKAGNGDALQGLLIDKNIPVVTVCAGGKTSLIAAEQLRQKGYEAYSLEEGMRGWSLSWNTAQISFPDFSITQLRRTGKGCLSYIISSKGEAIVIDASLPVNVYQDILLNNNWSLRAVLETHIHADHLSRSKQLAEVNAVPVYIPQTDKVEYPHETIIDQQQIPLGAITILVMHTPGHTLESTSFLVNNKVLLSGDTLFTNAVGRPDLKASEEETLKKTTLLYQSLQKLLGLSDEIIVLPAHTSQPVEFDKKPVQATLKEIRTAVPLLKLTEKEFVETLLSRIPPAPANYLSIVEKNTKGDFSGINPVDLEAGANRCAIS